MIELVHFGINLKNNFEFELGTNSKNFRYLSFKLLFSFQRSMSFFTKPAQLADLVGLG